MSNEILMYCQGCGWNYEQRAADALPTACPKCGGAIFSTEHPGERTECPIHGKLQGAFNGFCPRC